MGSPSCLKVQSGFLQVPRRQNLQVCSKCRICILVSHTEKYDYDYEYEFARVVGVQTEARS